MSSKSNATLLVSAARTATPAAIIISDLGEFTKHMTDMQIIVDVTALSLTPSVQPVLEGFDALSDKWYDLIDSISAITTVSVTAIKYGQNTAVLANNANQGFIPTAFRLRLTHADADSITYSVGINYLIE